MYFLFQTLGAFLGAAIIFAEYHGTCYVILILFLVETVYYVSSFSYTCFYFYFLDAMYDYAGEKNELLVTGEKATAGIFATYPNPHLTILNGFFDQVSNCKLVTNLYIYFCILLRIPKLFQGNFCVNALH